MTLFTSNRERRLWLWALVVLALIYATLGPAQQLAEALRARNLLRLSFGLGLALFVVVVVARGVKLQPGWREVVVALAVAAVYGIAFIRINTPEERTHLIEYGVAAVLIHQALKERVRNGRQVPLPAVLAVVATSTLGFLDEGIQFLLPNRVYDPRDLGFNAFAALLAIGASLALGWVRARFNSQQIGP